MSKDIALAATADRVATLWARTLRVKSVPRDAHFASLGGDSLLLLSLITELETTFGVELDEDEVIRDLTVDGMARAVLAAGARGG